MKLRLERTWPAEDCTIGTLYVDDAAECFTLEDRVREVPGAPVETWKVPGETAIPRGTYEVIVTYSQRFGRDMPLLLDVPGFSGIRIHPGNTDADTEGCILVGQARGPDMIYKSRLAFDVLFIAIESSLAAGQKVEIEIT